MVLTTRPSGTSIIQTRSQVANQSSKQSATSETAVASVLQSSTDASVNFSMATNIRLETFRGDSSEDIDRFLKRFDQYCACMNYKDTQALATLAWHLEGVARLYYENIEPAPTTLKELKSVLIQKFRQVKPVSLQIFGMTQEVNESAENFLTRLETESYKTRIGDDLQVQIALNGLQPSVSHAISTHAPKSLSDVRHLARRLTNVRPSASVAPTSGNSLENTMSVLTAAVAQLTTVLADKERNRTERPQRNRQSPKTDNDACSRCGGRCSSINSRRAMGKTCNRCGLKNHFSVKCRTARSAFQTNNS